MFNHIVLFKLKEFQDDQQKSAVREEIKGALLSLQNSITELKSIEVGTNFELSASSFDISLITRFDAHQDYLVYQNHPEHLKVVDLVRANTIDRAVTDYYDEK